jgi:hypothetical protein
MSALSSRQCRALEPADFCKISRTEGLLVSAGAGLNLWMREGRAEVPLGATQACQGDGAQVQLDRGGLTRGDREASGGEGERPRAPVRSPAIRDLERDAHLSRAERRVAAAAQLQGGLAVAFTATEGPPDHRCARLTGTAAGLWLAQRSGRHLLGITGGAWRQPLSAGSDGRLGSVCAMARDST